MRRCCAVTSSAPIPRTADAVVVGGGTIGAWCAWFGGDGEINTVNEWIDVKDMVATAQLLVETLRRHA